MRVRSVVAKSCLVATRDGGWRRSAVTLSRRMLLGCVVAAGVVACGSDDNNSSDDGSLAALVTVAITGNLSHGTLNRAQLFWDGVMVDDQSYAPAISLLSLSGSVSTGPGSHNLRVKLVSQSASPSTYSFTGYATAVNIVSGATESLETDAVERSVKNGGTVDFTVTLH